MLRKIILAAALTGTALGGAAYAAQNAAPATPAAGTHHLHRGHGDRLARIDTNHDGTITHAEAIAAAEARFARLDTNGDGTVTQQEMQANRAAMRAKWQERRAQRAAQGAPDGKAWSHRGPHRHGMMLKRLDTNGDGVITRAEAQAEAQTAAGKRFDRIDANHDGRIDQTEIAAAKAKMQARWQAMRAKAQANPAAEGQPSQPTGQ